MVRLLQALLAVAGATLSGSSESGGGEWWSGCPYHLIDVEEDGKAFHLSEEALRYLSRQASPLYVVPVLGVYRGGKSFLMNRCMGLRAPYSGGFGVGHSQDTHTRGIFVCAEYVEGLGTVVWMDTEGLFSSEYAKSAYGPKIFSLALLFSSAVLLNSVKVLNNEFFSFFSEQQQVARVLRHGLSSEGLPEGDLLPRNLSVVWVLQQPISYEEASGGELTSQLDGFLEAPGDEAREHIRRDFRHHLHVVPSASHNVSLWGKLDRASEDELSAAFLEASRELREKVLGLLDSARPLQAESVANQLRMYVNLVQTEQFSGKLVREAIEEAELTSRCGEYGRTVEERAGELPSPGLVGALQAARAEAEGSGSESAVRYHFGKEWEARLGRCLDGRSEELLERNEAKLLDRWQEKAREVAETSGCFFLDGLISMRDEDVEVYGRPLSSEQLSRTVKFAVALQRARLVECLRVKHLAGPFIPWLAWPLIAFYIRNGVVSGLTSLVAHGVVTVGVYSFLRTLKQVPPYLDVEFPVLRSRPQLLDATMQVLPWMPWAKLGTGFGATGACWCGYKLLRALGDSWRPAGHVVGGITALELKLNILLERSKGMMEQQLLQVLQDVHIHVCQQQDEQAAVLSLIRALCLFRSLSAQDPLFGGVIDARLHQRIKRFLDGDGPYAAKRPWEVLQAWQRLDIMGCAMRGDLTAVAQRILDILEANNNHGDSERAGLHNRAQRYLASAGNSKADGIVSPGLHREVSGPADPRH